MLKIDFGRKIVLMRDIEKLPDETVRETMKMFNLMQGALFTKDTDGHKKGEITAFHENIKTIIEEKIGKTDITVANHEILRDAEGCVIFGGDAVVEYGKGCGIDMPYTEKLDLPTEAFWECSPQIWYDISYLAARVINRINRLEKLLKLQCPAIISCNEERVLHDYIEMLEDNKGYCPQDKILKRDDGKIVRALNDIGFSVVHGWDEEMLKIFEERDARFKAEYEAIKAETERNMEEE